ncbi:hypothetical protein NM688_g7865 [Phlebia brevispora]|uniref:Uncharacterized protein n=1 Tax=Phlebia brevispora TaxID=194682 RepID=A0ACC1S072_9APHY|nr:hypothetical protein NM688_g7865 [Phlebia brevispora]
MPASEIDDIFAAKGKAKLSSPVPSTSKAPEVTSSKKTKKNSKKRKRETDPAQAPADEAMNETPVKHKVPETVIDPSVKPSLSSSSKKPLKKPRPSETKKKQKTGDKEEEERFKDSRGTGPRRKTEEGWNVYKEDELGITDNGGGEYPFDRCSPLYSSSVSTQIPRCVLLTASAVSDTSVYVPVTLKMILPCASMSTPSRRLWSGVMTAFTVV